MTRIPGSWFSTETVQYIDLAHNTNLRDLTLHDPTFVAVQRLLLQIEAPKLRMLTFRITPQLFGCGARATLATILGSQLFKDLNSMKFLYDGPTDLGVEAQVMSLLKPLHERKILHVAPAS